MLKSKGKTLPPARNAAAPLIAVAAAILSLASCGDSGQQDKKDEVPSLQQDSKKPAVSPDAADPDKDQPRIRLDSTPDEMRNIYNAYASCLKQHGGKVEEVTGPKAAGKHLLNAAEDELQPTAALKACKKKKPVPPPELDPNQNPNYADDFRASIKCINDHGIRIKALPDGSGWNYDASVSQDERGAPRTERILRECEIEAFK
ncbi:hypothetical protein [Streptomyces sp. NBC_00568]|uniref:hypothetical protein n=1 Tax=Streptomyces sp. NBC_00568 TaxID=2975779 RepID=UPI0022522269|nr:hypothetical protein [Streptomyces sp. NBC_00568]MCX4993621.1 hypothetical protein [Streptomyces sp. NBC_00568]